MTDKPFGFVALRSLKQGPPTPADAIAEIRRIYFQTTRKTIEHDIAHAIELLKTVPDEDTRDRAAVYMDGLSQMRSEWAAERKPRETAPPKAAKKTSRSASGSRPGPGRQAATRRKR